MMRIRMFHDVLPDVLTSGLHVVFCGTAAGKRSAAVGAYYAGPGNRFWPVLHEVGLTPRLLAPREFNLLTSWGIGLTDIAKHTSGSDRDLKPDDFDVPKFIDKILAVSPKIVAFNGKRAAGAYFGCDTCDLTYGRQAQRIGDSVIHVLPSTSAQAKPFWKVQHWRRVASSIRRINEGAR